eukprot:gb/GFBE01082717.1/.p1 GENE.gb/GFBE01082717.1/~~gb/GFBE01082717.1/.p1  ORF type:complete len:327 (+),score=53.78 gb/GFBE01082717.1/:1-981(+)
MAYPRWPRGLDMFAASLLASLFCCSLATPALAREDIAGTCVDGAEEGSVEAARHEVLLIQTDLHVAQRRARAGTRSQELATSLLTVLHDFTPIFAVLLGLCILVVITMTLGSRHFASQAAPEPCPAAGSLLQGKQPLAAARILKQPVPAPDADDPQPPAICPSLILPHSTACFTLSLHSIRTADKLDIRGTSGRKLLTALFGHGPQPFLSLAFDKCEGDPRCTVTGGAMTAALSVFGRRQAYYGTMEPMEHSMGDGGLLKCSGAVVMMMEVFDRAALHVAISTPAKRLLAEGRADTDGAWQLTVKPGADAVLIMSCILALARLWPA